MALAAGRKESFVPAPERTPIVERPAMPEIPPDIEGVEAVSGEINLFKPITDAAGQPIVSPIEPQQVIVQLPLDDQQTVVGLKVKATDSLRWLAEWTSRLLKIMAGKFIYKLRKNESN